MGCDIHFYVEQKIDGVWQKVEPPDDNKECFESCEVDGHTKHPLKNWYHNRNYALFGLLAGVRSTLFTPFVEPRGIPDDISSKLKVRFEDEGADAHSASYLTLSELLSFKDTVEDVPCFLDISGFKSFKKTGKVPDNYNYAPPHKIEAITNEKMERIMNLSAFLDEKQYWTKVPHAMSMEEISKEFWIGNLEAMKKLSENTDDVRCVFWFDN